jgi:hypothetical protein
MGRWEARHVLHFDVSEVINRYARAFDRKDWDLVRTCFHSDAVDDHGSTVGRAEDFLAFMQLRHRDIVESMHFNGNILLLEVDAPRREALVETYCVGWQRLSEGALEIPDFYASPLIAPDASPARLCTVGNRYLDVFSERDGELRISFRTVIYEWWQAVEYPLPPPFNDKWALATRDDRDPSLTTLDAMRTRAEEIRAGGPGR